MGFLVGLTIFLLWILGSHLAEKHGHLNKYILLTLLVAGYFIATNPNSCTGKYKSTPDPKYTNGLW